MEAIARSGLRIMAGLISGFDGEKAGADDRIVQFAEATPFPRPLLECEQSNLNQTTLTNFISTRPSEDIAREYIEAFCEPYDPERFLDRTYRHFLIVGAPERKVACPHEGRVIPLEKRFGAARLYGNPKKIVILRS